MGSELLHVVNNSMPQLVHKMNGWRHRLVHRMNEKARRIHAMNELVKVVHEMNELVHQVNVRRTCQEEPSMKKTLTLRGNVGPGPTQPPMPLVRLVNGRTSSADRRTVKPRCGG